MTIKDCIRRAASKFAQAGLFIGQGSDNVFAEARALVLPSLNLPLDMPDVYLDAVLSKKELKRVKKNIKARVKNRTPTAYLTNQAWFAGLEFYVDERVLVPRSPIAELIEYRFSPWLQTDDDLRILDLCTGSACIAIALAYTFQNALIDAVDISADALAVAAINCEMHGVEEMISLYQGDLFAPLSGKKYDLIVSNPPYVDATDMADLPAELQHEPTIGLAAGADGLLVIDKILSHAGEYLKNDGILVAEVGNSQTALQEKYPALEFTWLDLQRGGHGVFLLNRENLQNNARHRNH